MKTVAIIQARMGSTRLAGKVLRDLAGEPMLARVVLRVQAAEMLDQVLVATSVEEQDDEIEAECRRRGWNCVRGPELDVLGRYVLGARETDADVVVRITADCPFVDPAIIDRVVREYQENQPGCDYCANIIEPRTYPRGMDTEVVDAEALHAASRETKREADREHVTPFVRRHSERFPQVAVRLDEDLSDHRLTVDTPADLDLARKLWAEFDGDQPSMTDFVAFLENNPDVADINEHVQQKEGL